MVFGSTALTPRSMEFLSDVTCKRYKHVRFHTISAAQFRVFAVQYLSMKEPAEIIFARDDRKLLDTNTQQVSHDCMSGFVIRSRMVQHGFVSHRHIALHRRQQ